RSAPSTSTSPESRSGASTPRVSSPGPAGHGACTTRPSCCSRSPEAGGAAPMDETVQAPPHRLVEFLPAISRSDDPVSAARTAAELVAEEFDAEVGAVVVDERLATAVGFGGADVPQEALAAARPGATLTRLGVLGEC